MLTLYVGTAQTLGSNVRCLRSIQYTMSKLRTISDGKTLHGCQVGDDTPPGFSGRPVFGSSGTNGHLQRSQGPQQAQLPQYAAQPVDHYSELASDKTSAAVVGTGSMQSGSVTPMLLPLSEVARSIAELAATSTPPGLSYHDFGKRWRAKHRSPLDLKTYGCVQASSQ